MTQIDSVTSRSNPTLRLVRSLYGRRVARHRERLFVAEGLRTVSTLIEQRCPLVRLLIDVGRRDDVPASMLDEAIAGDAAVLAVDSELFRELADVDTPQPVIGVFAFPEPEISASPSMVVALDEIQDPGNLGSILRTCRAAGVDAVLYSKGTTDPYGPKVVRATAGQSVSLALIRYASPAVLSESAYDVFPQRIVVADSGRGTPHTEIDWTQPFILVLGNEAAGPSTEWDQLGAEHVQIAMASGVESLNVAAAAAVLIFEARKSHIDT